MLLGGGATGRVAIVVVISVYPRRVGRVADLRLPTRHSRRRYRRRRRCARRRYRHRRCRFCLPFRRCVCRRRRCARRQVGRDSSRVGGVGGGGRGKGVVPPLPLPCAAQEQRDIGPALGGGGELGGVVPPLFLDKVKSDVKQDKSGEESSSEVKLDEGGKVK